MREAVALAPALLHRRDAGHKLLVPYVTGGLGRDWIETLEAVAAAGADAVEVGLPFSDPMMDGPVIQRASVDALAGGATAQQIIAEIASADLSVPVAVMTYYNLIARTGHRRMARLMAGAGVTGAIVPDLPLEELDGWAEEADLAGVATVLLAAPTTPPERLKLIVKRARGFLYAVGSMGVTGERAELAASAAEIAGRCKAATELPVLVGVGVSTPTQAGEICRVADGVIVGSALVRRLLEGCGPDGAGDLVKEFRSALDG